MNLDYATLIEHMADALQDAPCLMYGDTTLSWRDYEQRAARIARALGEHGIGHDAKVGLFLYNCSEYMEGMLAAYKVRGVPININYRYVGDELAYLLNDCAAEALIFHSSLAEQVLEAQPRVPSLKLLICVDNGEGIPAGALSYARILQTHAPAQRIERSAADTLMLYTGGTTGMPKGVEFRIGDMLRQMVELSPMFFGIEKAQSFPHLIELAVERQRSGKGFVSLPASPLMHTAGILNSGMLIQLLGGAMVILTSRSFDPRELWRAIEHHRVNHIVVVGDTFVRPMLRVIEEDAAKGIQYDISSLKIVVSSGVIFSQASKLKLLELADLMTFDGVGATEGAMGVQIGTRARPPTETAHFTALPTTEIFDESYAMIARGSGKPGLIGIGGTLPQGYYKDPDKTARTFRVIDGKRWGFTGDMGTIDADGTMHFLGRGSGCINTGGEKVYPEEVEEAIKHHPAVIDCLVVGIPDERFGERVAAVVALREPLPDPTRTLMDFCAQHLARYKLPRTIKVVEQVQRAPNGKADYKWAKSCFAG
jgi:acyl-CoA synthetase (AMP-forming)/AMP-acid ligase II